MYTWREAHEALPYLAAELERKIAHPEDQKEEREHHLILIRTFLSLFIDALYERDKV